MSCWEWVMRSRVTNCSGVTPVACLNTREKWNGLGSTSSAKRSTENLLREMLSNAVLHLSELVNGKPAPEIGLSRPHPCISPRDTKREAAPDPRRICICRASRRKHLSAREAQ